MNTNKIVAALVALLAVGSASAQTKTNVVPGNVINIAGSTALSAVSIPAIKAYADANNFTLVASDSGATNALTTPGKIGLWTKTERTTNGTTVTVKTHAINVHFVGSEGGTLVAASKNTMPFLPLSITPGTKTGGDVAAGNGQGFTYDVNCSVPGNATITFSDVDQAVGRFNTAKTAPVKCVALTEVAKIAAINFAIAAPSNFPANNITDQQLKAILKNGHCPLSIFTGDAADATNGVFITGRDIDSGTRILTFVESGFGALTKANQYVWNGTSTNFDLSASNSVNGISFLAGDGGYFSGGTLCTAIQSAANNNVTNSLYSGRSYLIGYTSTKDLVGKTNTKALSYNGVAPYSTNGISADQRFSQDKNGIANGSYSLWSIGRLYKNTANAPKGTDKTVIDAVAAAIASNIATKTSADLGYGYTVLGDLNVTRTTEGAPIFKKN